VVSVSGVASHTRLKAHARDPFSQQKGGASTPSGGTVTTPTTGSGTSATGAGSTTGGTGGTVTGTGGVTSTPGSTGTTTTPSTPIVPKHPSKPAPTGLTSTEAYAVTVSITHGTGVDRIGSLERLGTLPSPQHPLLVELGVLKGGRRVLFAVMPGTVLSGPGSCTPGPINCQVLSLGTDQIESVSKPGMAAPAMFAVTAISARHYRSARAAATARSSASSLGRRLLSHSRAGALSLFPYKPGVGAIVDQRDLTIGGK
jgi:hypothetical protein